MTWKMKLAWAWLILVGLTVGFLVIGWLVLPTGEPFWRWAKAVTSGIALMVPAINYLRNERDRRELNRAKEAELEETDRKLDEIIRERNDHGLY